MGEATLETRSVFDPVGRNEDFDFELLISEIRLPALNDLAREYAAIDFESGHGELVMELQATQGQLTGYAKPLFHDMEVFSWQSDVVEGDKNPVRIAWEVVVEGVTRVFRNQPEQQFATRVPISGNLDDRKYGVLPAVAGVIRNAFVEAYRAEFERMPARRDDG